MIFAPAHIVRAILISTIGASCYIGYYAIKTLHYKSAFCQYHRNLLSFNSKKEEA